MVGAIGFLVNASILLLFADVLNMPFYVGQIIGAETALMTNFILHDNWTFASGIDRSVPKKKRLLVYHIAYAAGMAINSAVTIGAHYFLHFPSILALMVGSAVALLANFLSSRFIVWQPHDGSA